MRNRILLIALFVACLLLTGFQVKTRTLWEYKVISNVKINPKAEVQLNELGAEGWELVTYSEMEYRGETVGAGVLIFKRAK